MKFPQKNINMNSFKSSIGFFCFGVVVTSAIITFWRTPNKDWAPYIEDRNMFWSAQADTTSQQGRQNLWNAMRSQNTEIWKEIDRVNLAIEEMERPNSFYNEMMVQKAVKIFAKNAVMDYMLWEEDTFGDYYTDPVEASETNDKIDLPSNNR